MQLAMMETGIESTDEVRLTVTQRARLEMLSRGATVFDYTYVQPNRDFEEMQDYWGFVIITYEEDEGYRFRQARITQAGLTYLGLHKRLRQRRRRRLR